MKKQLRITCCILTCAMYLLSNAAYSQVICVFCYHQNNRISSNVNNLLLNGGFENTTCLPNNGTIGSKTSWCKNSGGYACDFSNWTSVNGGPNTYSCLFDNNYSIVAEGSNAVYFGNHYANACSPTVNDTSCLVDTGCGVKGIPIGYPINTEPGNYGGNTGVSLMQTVTGLTIGNVYVLEFWAGGEDHGYWPGYGVFGADVGFGNILLRNPPTKAGSGAIGTRYIIEFRATSTSHTMKFTNWGHICSSCTELVLDDARLYTLAEVSPSVPSCAAIAPPTALFSATPTQICENDCINFTNLSTGATSYQWTFSGAINSSDTSANPKNICYLAAGSYNVKLVASNGGGKDSITYTNYIHVNAVPPTPVITQAGTTLYTSTDTSYKSYQWYDSTALIPGATDTSLVVYHSGNYNLSITNVFGCKIAVGVAVILGLQSPLDAGINNNALLLFPNPAGDKLTVHGLQFTTAYIDIYNVLGEVVQHSPLVWRGESGLADVALLPRGIYFVHVTGERESRVGRFVKE